MNNLLNTRTVAYVATAGVLIGALYLLGRKAGQVVSDNLEVVTPSSPNNFVYRGVNAIGDIFNDGQDNNNFNLGYAIYDAEQWFKGLF